MDPFSRLPAPLLISVAKAVPDLPSLHSLRGASPVFAALLQEDHLATEILDVLLFASLAESTRGIVRATCLVLWRRPSSWSDVLGVNPVQPTRTDTPLPCHIPALPALRLFALATAVHRAAHRCLATLLGRCLALHPLRPVDPSYSYRKQSFWRWRPGQPFEPAPRPPAEPNNDAELLAAQAPLAWVEEQRALNGAWQLAFFSVVCGALENGPWEPVVADNVLRDPIHFWEALGGTTWLAHEYLQTIVAASPDGALYTPHWRLADVCPNPGTTLMPKIVEHISPMPATWAPGPDGLGSTQEAWMFLLSARALHYSPLRHVDLAPFRALGIALWEKPRLTALGFLSSDKTIQSRFGGRARLAEYSDLFTWHSLLSLDESQALEDRQRSAWTEGD